MGLWDELTKDGFGEYISVCERLDRQWIIDCLERDKYWEWLIHHGFQKSYQKWVKPKREEYEDNPFNWSSYDPPPYADYMIAKVGTDWETDYFWYFKGCLTKFVFHRLSRVLLQRPPWSDTDENYNAVDLLHRLSDRLLTAVIYLCIRNVKSAIYPIPPTGQSDLNLFYSLFNRHPTNPVEGEGVGSNNLKLPSPNKFKDSDVGMLVEFSGGTQEVDRTVGFINSITDENNAVLDCIVPTSESLDVHIFHHPKHENAKALIKGFEESYQGASRTNGLCARLNALQHAAIYVNESKYDIHTIKWDQHAPKIGMNCDIYKLDFDNDPPTATQATTSFAGENFNYTTKIIAMQYETIQESDIDSDHLPLVRADFQQLGLPSASYSNMEPQRPDVERLSSKAVRLSSAYHHPSGKDEVTAADGVLYAFTWTEYFGFAWVPWNQCQEDQPTELIRPIDFLPPIPDDFEISEDELLDQVGDANGATKNDRNHPHTGTGSREGYDLVGDQHAAVTWHWTAGETLRGCTNSLGRNGSRKTDGTHASVNFGVGKAFKKYKGKQSGIMRYAGVDRVTNHAGAGVERRINGAKSTHLKHSTSRNSVGIETCNIGYARRQGQNEEKTRKVFKTVWTPKADWLYIIPKNAAKVTNWRRKDKTNNPSKRDWWRIEPWPPEQIALCVYLGKHIISELPHITMRNHHGHHDTCSGRKVDIIGFPFARVLRCLYPDEIVPDVWSQFVVSVNRGNGRRTTYQSRQSALLQFNYDMGTGTTVNENIQIQGVDGGFGTSSKLRLKNFKTDRNSFRQELRDGSTDRKNHVPVDICVDSKSYWCTFTCWEVHDAMVEEWVRPND